jgi:hypothetical protein
MSSLYNNSIKYMDRPEDAEYTHNPLESSKYRIFREKDKLVIPLFEVFNGGDLYSTQPWIKEADIKKAQEFNDGVQSYYYPRFPLVYWALLNNRLIFLVGDGHHRIADSILKGVPIKAEIDLELKDLTTEIINDPNKAQIKYAKYGLYGIWTFQHFIDRYKEERSKLYPDEDFNDVFEF